MKNFRTIRESLSDFTGHSTKKLKTILQNPNHPHHANAKAEMERRNRTNEAFGRARLRQNLAKQGKDLDKMHSDNVKDHDAAKKRSKAAADDLAAFRKQHGMQTEISQKAKDDYIKKSHSNWQHMSAIARDSGTPDDQKAKLRKKMKDRNKGMARAFGEEKDTHVTKDGKTAKKGLWYYMNKRKKAGTSRPKSAGTVDPDALKKSQK